MQSGNGQKLWIKKSDGSWPVSAEVTRTQSHCSTHREQTAGGPRHPRDGVFERIKPGRCADFLFWHGSRFILDSIWFIFFVLCCMSCSFKKGVTRSDRPPGGRRDSSFPWRADEHAWGLGGRRERRGGAPRLWGVVRKKMGAPERRWDPAVHRETNKRDREHLHSLGDRKRSSKGSEDCREFAAIQKVTEWAETKPGGKHPPHKTQRAEAVHKLFLLFFLAERKYFSIYKF